MAPISVTIKYSLAEYLDVVETYMPYEITGRKLGRKSWEIRKPEINLGLAARWLVRAFATGAFFYKVNRIGICSIVFNDAGFIRKSKTGSLNVAWSEVERVFRLPVGYLIIKQNGAMPVPYSSLTSQQLTSLEELLSSVGHDDIQNAA